MRYFGGKARVGKQIAGFIDTVRKPGQVWVEPFCGGLGVTQFAGGVRLASDKNEALITLYKAVQSGWVPPDSVSRDLYEVYKRTCDPSDPLTAFIGFGCSFAGKWFGGYASSGERNYAANAKNSLLKKMGRCKDVLFSCGDFAAQMAGIQGRSVVYMDPPYEKTTGYAATGSFDAGLFWSAVRIFSRDHDVYVSEYSAPPDFECVLEMRTKTDIRTRQGRELRTEKLFRWKG